MRTVLYYGFIAAVAIAGVILAVDAIVVTDQERLESFVEGVTGDVRSERIDHALSWTDLGAEPVEVVFGDQPRLYEQGQEGDLADDAREILAPLEGESVRLLQDAIEIDGTSARVALRVSTDEGVCDVQYLMRKHGEDWLVTRVRVL
jgi:hypothetical protein